MTIYLYAILRKEMSAGALLSQHGHAVTECLLPEHLPLPKDTVIRVLGATKDELARLRFDLDEAEIHSASVLETDGPLAGVITALSLVTTDPDALKARVPLLAELKRWKEPKSPFRGLSERALKLLANVPEAASLCAEIREALK